MTKRKKTESKRKSKKQTKSISVTIPIKWVDYIEYMKSVFGSYSSYIRYLIWRDMLNISDNQTNSNEYMEKKVLRKTVTYEISSTRRPTPPKQKQSIEPPKNIDDVINDESIPIENRLIMELKSVLKNRKIE